MSESSKNTQTSEWFWRIIIACIILLLSIVFIKIGTSSSFQRGLKSFGSDFNGGLYRTVTVYDYNGDEIKSYSGKFDVSESENEVYFDLDDKRVIIHGGIIINEEN